MDSGVAVGCARRGPGRAAVASGRPHCTPARRAPAPEPRLAAWLGRARHAWGGRDRGRRATRELTPCPPLRSAEGGGGAFPRYRTETAPGGADEDDDGVRA